MNIVPCPNCSHEAQLPDAYAEGERVHCPECGQEFVPSQRQAGAECRTFRALILGLLLILVVFTGFNTWRAGRSGRDADVIRDLQTKLNSIQSQLDVIRSSQDETQNRIGFGNENDEKLLFHKTLAAELQALEGYQSMVNQRLSNIEQGMAQLATRRGTQPEASSELNRKLESIESIVTSMAWRFNFNVNTEEYDVKLSQLSKLQGDMKALVKKVNTINDNQHTIYDAINSIKISLSSVKNDLSSVNDDLSSVRRKLLFGY